LANTRREEAKKRMADEQKTREARAAALAAKMTEATAEAPAEGEASAEGEAPAAE